MPTGRHSLYRNNGDGTFTEVSEQAGVAKATQGYGMTVVAADLDEDGWPDIYVACDSTPSLLFMNNHDGTFREEGVLRGVALSEDGTEQAGMGVGVGDYDLDGHLDLFKTHFADDANGLYHNDGKGNFDDVTRTSRLGVETRYVCWGAGIVDLDNDGHPDLFMVTGNVYPEVERKLPQYANKTPRAVFRNLGNGTFEELMEAAGPAVAEAHCSRGCAFGDFDNDGDVDVLVVNLNEPPSLLRNDLRGKQNWIKVKLEGVKSNRSAIGARVLARYGGKTQAQAVLSQSSFYSCNDPRCTSARERRFSRSGRVLAERPARIIQADRRQSARHPPRGCGSGAEPGLVLELEFGADLPPPRQRLARHLAEVSGAQVARDVDEVRVVEQVVELEPQLETDALRDRRVLVDGQVRLHEVRVSELIHLLVAVRTRSGLGELSRRKDPGQECVARSLVIVAHVGVIQVVAIGVVVTAAGERRAREDREGSAALIDAGAAQPPASFQAAGAGNVVVAAEGEAIGNVPRRRPIELMGIDRRRVDAAVVLRRGAGVRGVEEGLGGTGPGGQR
jgi:hypothetical protein